MEIIKDVETNSISLRIRKEYTSSNLTSHTVLTDDIFSYVDFFFKTHKRRIKDVNGNSIKQDYVFYWEQAKNFYWAAKSLPIESAPLNMYYSMLNAVKAYLLYSARSYEDVAKDFSSHGLHEGTEDSNSHDKLDNIMVKHLNWGVFDAFGKKIDANYNNYWKNGNEGSISLKELFSLLPYTHVAYISTYNVPRKNEKFIPLKSGTSPTFKYCKDKKIRLVVDIDKKYFKQDAISIPDELLSQLTDEFEINENNGFQLISKSTFRKNDIKTIYNDYRKHFVYIKSDSRIWYIKKDTNDISKLNTMILTLAITHRLSEIVRYKPEQMIELLSGKENWLIHEFISHALDQFMDEIACEITKNEIMSTCTKS